MHHEDDTPIFDAVNQMLRAQDSLLQDVYTDHYDRHEGPIRFCDALACKRAWRSVRRVA